MVAGRRSLEPPLSLFLMLTRFQGMGSTGPAIRLADTEIRVLSKIITMPTRQDSTELDCTGLGLDLVTKRESGHDIGVRIPSICFCVNLYSSSFIAQEVCLSCMCMVVALTTANDRKNQCCSTRDSSLLTTAALGSPCLA